MKEFNFAGAVQKAIFDYDMIQDGDRVAVGVSGGKDSLALLTSLSKIRPYSPVKFDLVAITLGLGLEKTDFSPVQTLCDELEIPFFMEETHIGEIVFNIRKEASPCALCANLRRGALNNKAVALGCGKIALGHHRDDAIETMAMSLFYEGRFHCFSPVTYLSRKDIHVIRPLIYVKEMQVIDYCREHDLQIVKSPCPATGKTNRARIRETLDKMEKDNPDIRELLFGSIRRAKICGW
jgi:tRNA(Ile)-lysidine synthetase-like protein